MKNKALITNAILALLIFGSFYLIYYKPKSQDLESLIQERIKVETEVVKSRAKKKELDKIEAELASMDNTLKELEVIIPQKKEISNILRRIQQLGYDSRLNITNFAPQRETLQEFYSEQPIKIAMTGNYHNLGLFFDDLSHFSRLFTVDNFSIKALSSQSDANTISIDCLAKTFIFHEEALENEASNNGKRGK